MAPTKSSPGPVRLLGVGIDTARYGHHVSFLRDDRQPAAPPLTVLESRAGYRRLETQLRDLHARHPEATMHVRIDAAGQYAVNLESFLRQLDLPLAISLGEPKRNKDYHHVHFPKRQSDATESLALARYAVVEQPPASRGVPHQHAVLRRVAGRLQAQVRQSTRLTNQLHETLSATFPELATLTKDIATGWVLQLLRQYPSPARIAAAPSAALKGIPYRKSETAQKLQAAARDSVGACRGEVAEQLVRQLVEQLQASLVAEEHWKKLLEQAFDDLPEGPHRHIATIPGIGKLTAAAIVATAVSIDRFLAPEHLVGYYGVFPRESTSGVDKLGRPLPAGKKLMCPKGNDLVRGLLWNCAKAATQCNPAVRSLYRRLIAKGVRGDVAFGYGMTKLLHLVYALWKTGQPFDPQHYPWEPEEPARAPTEVLTNPAPSKASSKSIVSGSPTGAEENVAGRKGQCPEDQAVTATTASVAHLSTVDKPEPTRSHSAGCFVDFGAVRSQVTLEQVLRHLGLMEKLRRSAGRREQYRSPCPIHQEQNPQRRTFSVNLAEGVFRCFDANCQAQGNVLDFWAAFQKQPLHEAALSLVHTFGLNPTQPEQRRGTR